jgi:hypothetical protein
MSNLSPTPPSSLAYEFSEADVLEAFSTFERGDSGAVTHAVVDAVLTALDIAVHDMDNLDKLAQWYGPVYSSGETLIAALTNHPGGKVAVSSEMGLFADLAQQLLAKETPPQKPTKDQLESLKKLIAAGQSASTGKAELELSALDAKNLANFLQAGMRFVVPGDLKPEALSSQADAVKQLYNQKITDMADAVRRPFDIR